MIRHFIITAIRHFYRIRAFSLINITGLAVGITISLLLFFLLRQELSYDQFHENKDQIYRLITGDFHDEEPWVGTPAPLAHSLSLKFPEIESYVRIDQAEFILEANEKTFNEENTFLVDSNFFEVFSFGLLAGSPGSVLKDPYSVVLTESTAEKYFGSLNPVGQSIRLQNTDMKITGIAADVPNNSHFRFDLLARFDLFNEEISNYDECWGCFNFVTYLLLNDQADPDVLESKIKEFSIEDEGESRSFERLNLQALSDIHFQYVRGNFETSFSRKYVIVYSALIAIILAMACINYINLNIAIAPIRFKEVGIKKTFGANRTRLTFQFITESILSTLFAIILAVFLTIALLPSFNQLFSKQLDFQFNDPIIIISLILSAVLIGILIGIYPALFTSSVSVSRVMKGVSKTGKKSWFRDSLVVFQFVISIVFFLFAFILNKQLHYIQHQNLGFDREHILNISFFPLGINSKEDLEKYRGRTVQFRNLCDNHTTVQASTINNFTPSTLNRNHGVVFEGQQDDQHFSVFVISGDKDFVETYGIELVSSTDKVDNFEFTGTFGYILNETAVKKIGWDQPLDRSFSIFGPDTPGKVVGVCKDFHYRSFHHQIGPCVIVLGEPGVQVSLKTTGNPAEFITYAEKEFAQIFPGAPFEYFFFDEDFNKLYQSDIRTIRSISMFTIISLVIACLGLYGLASYYTVQRTKEIGVRKALGAARSQIILMFFREISLRILIAVGIGTPIAVYLAGNWLKNFEYKTTISWWIIPISAFVILIIALLTISYQTLKAAGKNPVDVLRYE